MAIYANTVIQDALALVDVVSPGEAADPWFSKLAVRLLNGLLSEWALKGYYNPTQLFAEYTANGSADFYTIGIDDSLVTINDTKYTVVGTPDIFGTYYLSVSNDGLVTKYSTTGTGTRYSLVVNQDTNGTYYAISGGYSQKITGNIPVNIANIQSIQVDLGSIVYQPRQVTLEEYLSISVKDTTAPPTVYAWDFQQPISKLYFWPKPLTNMNIRVVGSASIASIANTQSNIEIDQMYYTALLYNLATKIYPFLKRDAGMDPQMIYLAKTSVSGLRSRTQAMRSRHVTVPYGGNSGASDYWRSALNSVTGSN